VGSVDEKMCFDSCVFGVIMIFSRHYLLFASSVAFFRVGVYILRPKTVTQIKIDPKAWEDPRIQEISYAYTNTIRTLMLLKGVIFSYCSSFRSNEERDAIALISFGFDIWMWLMMVGRLFSKTEGGPPKALLPPTTSAMTIQTVLTTSYLFFSGLEYFGFDGSELSFGQ
jgi:hypothetical protein